MQINMSVQIFVVYLHTCTCTHSYEIYENLHITKLCIIWIPYFLIRHILLTVVSRVSAHGCLNMTHDFGLHGRLPGIKIPYVCIEAAIVAP